jgi:serine/threonine-protein kinase RsbW
MRPLSRHIIVIASRLEEVHKITDPIRAAARACGFAEQALFAIRLALEDAISNAIRHGNHGDPAKQVTTCYRVNGDKIEIDVRDEGTGFSPRRIPDPTLDENLDRPTGRGLMLMRAYMSEVHYNRRGNCVTLVKRRDCCLPHPPSRPNPCSS